MLKSALRDPQVEFVAEQLKRVNWISGYTYVGAVGYQLDWSIQGIHRMMLLQIALKNSQTEVHGLDRLSNEDSETHASITDFWEACLGQLSLSDQKDAIPAFVKVIESWQPRG